MSDTACKFTPHQEFLKQLEIIKSARNIAVVGMSSKPDRPSYEVGLYLKNRGYQIIPVHPREKEISGMKVFPTLSEAAKIYPKIDIVDLFVAGERTLPIVQEAKQLGIPVVWFQPGAENDEAIKWALEHNMKVVSGACTMAVLKRAAQ